MATIRRAVVDDVAGIGAVILDAWQTEIDVPYCEELIAEEKQIIHVADFGGEIAGFVAGFPIALATGGHRWEIDLIAVHRDRQGQKLATKLIHASLEEGAALNMRFARSIIHVDNTASQSSFEKAGFQTIGSVYDLYLWNALVDSAPQVPSTGGLVTYVPVETLTYRGLWIEGLNNEFLATTEKRSYVKNARIKAHQDDLERVGVLYPSDKAFPEDLRSSATLDGHYQVWRYTF